MLFCLGKPMMEKRQIWILFLFHDALILVRWHPCAWQNFTNPIMHLFHIPQCSIQHSNVHISVLNGALQDMEQVHSGICEYGQSKSEITGMLYVSDWVNFGKLQLSLPLWSRMGPKWDWYSHHEFSAGPVPAYYGMFPGNVLGSSRRSLSIIMCYLKPGSLASTSYHHAF